MRCCSLTGMGALLAVLAAMGAPAFGADALVIVDPSTRYQTIEAWGATTPGGTMPDALRAEMIDLAVNEWGLTRLRFEGNQGNNADNGRGIEWTNDNADPLETNQAALSWDYVDWRARNWLVPFKQKVEANGDPFTLYVSFSFFNNGGSGAAPVWLLRSPGEHSEYMLDLLKRLRDVHGVTATYCTVINEPRNGNGFDAAVQAADIKALAPRLEAEGFPDTKIEFPEGVNVRNALEDVRALQNDDQVWRHVGLVAYHRYGGTQALTQLRDLAFAKGKRTGQTEAGGLNMDVLYEDLTAGGCSVWEVYIWGALYTGSMFSYDPDGTSFRRRDSYWELQQVMRHVRPGAVRIGAASSADPQVRALAFDQRGAITTILDNRSSASCEVTVTGLPAGVYGVTRASDSPASYTERGLQTVAAAGGSLVVTMPPETVSAVYPHAGANLAPVPTRWRANPTYLTVPNSETRLSATATDPERDPITYGWSVVSQPAGASVRLATPSAADTQATGLTAAGDYVFRVRIGDTTHAITKDVRLKVHAGNEPPVVWNTHNRVPVHVFLPAGRTDLLSAVTDLEKDALSYRWSVVSQPPGAHASLAAPAANRCTASNMSVAGDYVFRFDAWETANPGNAGFQTLTVPVFPANTPCVIDSATAEPSTIVQPGSTTRLAAQTHDPDGDAISHWWMVTRGPTGADAADVTFTHQGQAVTDVTGLTTAGNYTFQLVAVDRAGYATRSVTVTVRPGPRTD